MLLSTDNTRSLIRTLLTVLLLRHQVLEMLRRRSASSEEHIDAMGLLQTLCLVKMDTVDGKKPFSAAAEKKQPAKGGAAADVGGGGGGGGYSPYHSGAAAANDCRSAEPPEGNDHRLDTEMKGELQEQQDSFYTHLLSSF